MNAGGRAKTRRRGVARLFAQSLDVGDVEVDCVDRRSIVRARTEENLGPGEAGEVSVLTTLVATRTPAERGEQVLGAPHKSNCRCGRGNGRRFEDTRGGLAERDDLAAREGVNLNTGLGLGQHDQGVRRLTEGLEVEGEVRGADGIHSKNRSLRIEQVVNDRSSSDDPITSVDTVFQVEDYHVGHRRGLGESIGTVCGQKSSAGPSGVQLTRAS